MTVEEFRRLAARANAEAKKQRPGKYHACREGGYDSRREHSRARQLRLLQAAGAISNLREQVPYILIPAQRDASGHLIERQCSYRADFVYTDTATGAVVVEDTKGVRTPQYIIKRKLMLYVHGIRIREV